MTSRKLAALKALADRPGTEAEGAVARAKYKEALAKSKAAGLSDDDGWKPRTYWERLARDGFIKKWKVKCACGEEHLCDEICKSTHRHENIRSEVKKRFKKGDVVYYNKWAYDLNTKAKVVGFPKPDSKNWAWIRLKFDHLSYKTKRG